MNPDFCRQDFCNKLSNLETVLGFVDGDFEPLEIAPLSTPPELPDVMKPQDSSSSHAPEQVHYLMKPIGYDKPPLVPFLIVNYTWSCLQ